MTGNPHIITVHESGGYEVQLPGKTRKGIGLVLDLQDPEVNPRLSDYLRKKRVLPENEMCHVALGVARALAAGTRAGIIHGDVKSENIYWPSILADWDVAKRHRNIRIPGGSMLPATPFPSSILTGTLHYMGLDALVSPEDESLVAELQKSGGLTFKHDVHSLGVLCYLGLTGTFPYGDPAQDQERLSSLAADRATQLIAKGTFQPSQRDSLETSLTNHWMRKELMERVRSKADMSRVSSPFFKQLIYQMLGGEKPGFPNYRPALEDITHQLEARI